MSKHPLTIADFKKGWDMVLQKEEENSQFPIHPFGTFCEVSIVYCNLCNMGYDKQSTFQYSKLCFGKRR